MVDQVMRSTLFTTSLVVLLVQFDTTVVNLALHAIQTSLGSGVTLLQGILDAYNVVYASAILTGATLGDLFGRRRMLAIGIGLFTAASLLCGVAPSAGWLIVGRALAGVGAALALPGSLAVLRVGYPDATERARALGIWAGVNGVAVALGPAAGGVLVNALGWRSIFLVAVPLGCLAMFLTLTREQESADPAGRHLDLPGQVLAILGLGCLAASSISGQTLGWLSTPILAGLLVGAGLLTAFVTAEARSATPLLPLEVFRNVALSGSLAVMTAITFGMFGMLLVVPLYLQAALGQSAATAGLALVPMGIAFACVSAGAGRIVGRIGARVPIAGGAALAGLGLLIIAQAGQPTRDLLAIVGGMTVVGVALGLLTGPLMAVAVGNVEPERAGLAAGLVNVGRMLGATFGVAVLGGIFGAMTQAGQDPAAFGSGMRAALLVAVGVEWLASILAVLTIHPGAAREPESAAQASEARVQRRRYA